MIALLILVMAVSLAAPALAANEPMQYKTEIKGVTGVPDGTLTITNNFNAKSIIEIELETAVDANVVFKVYSSNSPMDKTTLLGSITVKKNAKTGKLSVAAGKLTSYQEKNSVFLDAGAATIECVYGAVGETTALPGGSVTVKNAAVGPEFLVVSKSALINGMTVQAIVNGRAYKGTVKDTTRDFYLSLAKDLEVGTAIWYSVAAPGCRDTGFSMLELKGVVQTDPVNLQAVRVFFQGDSSKASSIMVTGLDEGTTVRCYDAADAQKALKTATVAKNGFLATLTGLSLKSGMKMSITVAAKGDAESTRIDITVPDITASSPVKAADVKTINSSDGKGVITVKGSKAGDVIKFYSAEGVEMTNHKEVTAAAPDAAVRYFEGFDLGPVAAKIYVSATSAGSGESVWTAISVKAPLVRTEVEDVEAALAPADKDGVAVTLTLEGVPLDATVQLYKDEFAQASMGNSYKFTTPKTGAGTDETADIVQTLQTAALLKAAGAKELDGLVVYCTITESGRNPSKIIEIAYTDTSG